MIQKIEDVKRPVKIGEKFLVPCLVNPKLYDKKETSFNDNSDWHDIPHKQKKDVVWITPIINHPHTDIENGQKISHFHVDYRFVKHKNDNTNPSVINNHSTHKFVSHFRVTKIDGNIEYLILPVINEYFAGITPVEMISKSKLKHKCIHKGKCPHRGMDLSQVHAKGGIITCPLHGLQFDENTKQLLNNPTTAQ